MLIESWNIDRNWTLFLDRDGVINQRIMGGYVTSPAEFEFLPGALEAIALFSRQFHRIVVVTNQQGIGKGIMTERNLLDIHRYMIEEIQKVGGKVDQVYFAPELKSDVHSTRKPKPAMLKEILHYFNLAPQKSVFFVGDSLRDLQAAQAIGIAPILVLTGHGRETRTNNAELCATIPIFSSLAAFVKDMIN